MTLIFSDVISKLKYFEEHTNVTIISAPARFLSMTVHIRYVIVVYCMLLVVVGWCC